MDNSVEPGVRRPCTNNYPTNCQFHRHHYHHHDAHGSCRHHHHHHHHFHVSPNCPQHSYMLYLNNHSSKCPHFTSLPQIVSSCPIPNVDSQPLFQSVETATEFRSTNEVNEEWEEEEEDPVFVLTDEWREFFAISEAKRRLAKKQAKVKAKKAD